MTVLACVDFFPAERVVPLAILALAVLGAAGAGLVAFVTAVFRG